MAPQLEEGETAGANLRVYTLLARPTVEGRERERERERERVVANLFRSAAGGAYAASNRDYLLRDLVFNFDSFSPPPSFLFSPHLFSLLG